jgi:hypothetical protein
MAVSVTACAQRSVIIASGFCEAIPDFDFGDCFVAKIAPRNDFNKIQTA